MTPDSRPCQHPIHDRGRCLVCGVPVVPLAWQEALMQRLEEEAKRQAMVDAMRPGGP